MTGFWPESIAPALAALIVLAVFLASCVATRLAAMRVSIFDHPNTRSSHDKPTPKTGGLAVIGVWFLFAYGLYAVLGPATFGIEPSKFYAFTGLVVLTLIIAVVDDVLDIPAAMKMGGQLGVAVAFALVVASIPHISLPGVGAVELGAAGYLVTVLWIVGFMNVFNFMDGLNGMAGGVGAIAAIALAVLGAAAGAGAVFWFALLLAPALLGFLVFNFPAGKVFLGDNGSQPVGLIFAGLAVCGAQSSASGEAAIPFLAAPILFAPFLFDAAVTLVHRALRRRNVLAAHREHLYQLLNRSGYSHASVSGLYMLMTAFCAVAAYLTLLVDPQAELLLAISLLPALVGYSAFVVVEARDIGPFASALSAPAAVDDIDADSVGPAASTPAE